jgi:hypothetical protein
VRSFFLPWRRKRKKAMPESAKLLSAVLTTATAMSLRLVEDEEEEEAACGGARDGPAGDGDGDAMGGTLTAGVRTEGNLVWTFRGDCAAARGQRTAAAAMRRRAWRRGEGAIGAAGAAVRRR